ncbi:MAG: DinB family protein [Pseudomonadota bacterium]
MSRTSHILLMASYNATMNRNMYHAARALPAQALAADRKAFFGSILGTLNHLVNGDTIWLKRFAAHRSCPQLEPVRALAGPATLGEMQFNDIATLWERRRWLDELILAWAATIAEDDLDQALAYENSRGSARKDCFSLIMHFFNHQTHHRGQVSTLLSQQGIDIGVTDLLMLIADESAD